MIDKVCGVPSVLKKEYLTPLMALNSGLHYSYSRSFSFFAEFWHSFGGGKEEACLWVQESCGGEMH